MNHLAPYAAHETESLGRIHPEPLPSGHRGEYQRDRDRIVHSGAFRRLEYKTQVFVNHEGDLYRTRLTHSLEVAQIGRSICGALQLNESLCEAICLAHDLGHTPFGHAGQDALNECMREHGGFEHNLQSLRVVDELEERYAEFSGLNLTFECREGILKHCSARNARNLGALGRRFLEKRQPSLEAQLANVSDEIAYNNHDVDDGLRSGLLDISSLRDVALFARHHHEVERRYPGLTERRQVHEVIRRMINEVVNDLIEATRQRLRESNPKNIEDIRSAPSLLVGFSERIAGEHRELKLFLRERLYRHYRVVRMTSKARRVVRELFESFQADLRLLPEEHRQVAERLESRDGPDGRARAVADYVAGMTDRYAILEHARVHDPAAVS
jgi:dGTPase